MAEVYCYSLRIRMTFLILRCIFLLLTNAKYIIVILARSSPIILEDVMARLLVFALSETTRQETGYEVIARDIDENKWVIIPALPTDQLIINGIAAWDIFAVTEADISPDPYSQRSGVYEVQTSQYLPRMINKPITDNEERNSILDKLAMSTIEELDSSPEWVGLLREVSIEDVIFREKPQPMVGYNLNRTFFWECRLLFHDKFGREWLFSTKQGTTCKDMRFKAYWKSIALRNGQSIEANKEKWIDYMQVNRTYLLVEYITSKYRRQIPVISGVLCIKQV